MQNWVSFDLFRTAYIQETLQIKPEKMHKYAEEIKTSLCVLFPEYWQLNTLLYVYGCSIYPSEPSYRIGHNKIEMTRVFEALVPSHVPLTYISHNTPLAQEEILENLSFPFVAKLSKSSQGAGVWRIDSLFEWRVYCQKTEVLYAQEFLPINRDLRLVVVAGRVIGSYWRRQSIDGFHNNVSKGGEIIQEPAPYSAISLVETLCQTLGINHGGFDIAMVGDHPYVLEVNRLFGNQGIVGGEAIIQNIISDHLCQTFL
jgi:ribosomal protein S6--L-glutamate ligase